MREKIRSFIRSSNIEIIEKLMQANNGYVTSKIITDLGISRQYLTIMQNRKMIEKVGRGIYMSATSFEDNYYKLSIQFKEVVFSHMTALYFYGLSPQAPHTSYDITVHRKYNSKGIKKHNIFYVNDDIYDIGLTEISTPNGNKVRAYDLERCICDIIRSIKRMDNEHVIYVIKEYLKRDDKDIKKLSRYADKIGIRDKVMNFVGMFYE